MDELMETNVELLLMVGALCVFFAVRRDAAAAIAGRRHREQPVASDLASPSTTRKAGQ